MRSLSLPVVAMLIRSALLRPSDVRPTDVCLPFLFVAVAPTVPPRCSMIIVLKF